MSEYMDMNLTWGLKESFRQYVQSAGGQVVASEGAQITPAGWMLFPAAPGNTEADLVRFRGTVVFSAHGGLLAVRLTAPWVEREQGRAALSVAHPALPRQTGRRLTLAELELSEAASEDLPLHHHRHFSARLALDAIWMFDGLYSPGTSMDLVSIGPGDAHA